MDGTVKVLSGAGFFVGGAVIVMGGLLLMFQLNQQNRITGPILLMCFGAMVQALSVDFAAEV